MSKGQPHILVFPFPAQGHLLPLLDLTHQLSLRNLTITILVTPKNLSSLNQLLSLHPNNIQTLILPFPPHPNLPPGVENARDVGNHGHIPIINALSNLQEHIIQWFHSHPNPPIAIVSDFFLGWTLRLAHRINIPRISFFSSGAFSCSLLQYCWNNLNDVRGLPVVCFEDFPNSPSFKEQHLPTIFRRYVMGGNDPELQMVKDGMIANIESWGGIFNSFDELDGQYFDYLRTTIGLRRVYGVGPLSLIGVSESSKRVDPNIDSGSGSEILGWLDGCSDGSVLYVCFGRGDGVPDSAELGKVIAETMSLDAPQRLKVKEVRDKAFAAVNEGGSSCTGAHVIPQKDI
ncbi:hypothetical protein FEM48_Zijuj10G0105100 [Ziziphus jujuba var. spinosa]|uniref:Glycosyltransferase N-terminal domain-containing protein n=1 Tax=Ziziphus jujuba var. spinosa TaxID=714518 RepID=A0A978UMV2_ZIZJJ|nr:hypothetical protein FEM48_Zijuj10G0105100 [Ziziphus jujuba var. spinosa]